MKKLLFGIAFLLAGILLQLAVPAAMMIALLVGAAGIILAVLGFAEKCG